MMSILIVLLISFNSSLVLAWNSANNPNNFGVNLERSFAQLPLKGEVSNLSLNWAGYHWPHNKMSINYRWTLGEDNTISRKPTLAELRKMGPMEINGLSPAEKFDVYQSRYDYPTVMKAQNLSRQNASDWNGICHGLAAASINHPEPRISTVSNSDGVKISFFSSDVKALLSFSYAQKSNEGVSQIGKRCFFSQNTPIVWRHNSCTDIDAGSFHLILTNLIGMRGVSFIADLDRFKEVWNHSLKSYTTKVISRSRNSVKVETTITYPDIINPQYGPLIGTSFDYLAEKTYQYVLYLGSNGEITGGHWLGRMRPDFIWIQKSLKLDPLLENLLN